MGWFVGALLAAPGSQFIQQGAASSAPTEKTQSAGSHIFGHNIGRAISTAQETIGFFIANHRLGLGVEVHRASQAIRSVGEVHKRCGLVRFQNRRVNILGAAAANTVNEILIVVAGSFAGWAGFNVISDPGLVGVIAFDAEVAV